jgi:hypothetical protein
MSKIVMAGTFATLLCASLAAQAPTQTPAPSPSSPALAQPSGDPSQPPTAAPAQSATGSPAKAGTITVQGCITPSVNAVSATPDAVGTSGTSVSTATAFILATAMNPAGTSGSSAASSAPVASAYQLDVEDSKLIPHVGHKVEISGTVVATPPTTAAASARGATPSPTLKVETVRMIAATCTQ